jgi:hypothetical protein
LLSSSFSSVLCPPAVCVNAYDENKEPRQVESNGGRKEIILAVMRCFADSLASSFFHIIFVSEFVFEVVYGA